jgi:hypothetical protein
MKKWLTEKWSIASGLPTKKRLVLAGAVLAGFVCRALAMGLALRQTGDTGNRAAAPRQQAGQANEAKPDGKSAKKFFGGRDVYVAGSETFAVSDVMREGRSTRATVWKNGVAQHYANDGGWTSAAFSVFVSGDDVYAAGVEDDHATLWKNGEAQRLSNDSGKKSRANSVFVSGSDVYVAGTTYTYAFGGFGQANLWKNGIEQELHFPGGLDSSADSVFVSGDDVYVAGEISEWRVIWKNGIGKKAHEWPTSRAYLLANDRCNTLFVANGDVYLAGSLMPPNSRLGHATLWKNGIAQRLSETNTETDSKALSVYVSGEDVYVAGGVSGEVRVSYGFAATLWENGVAQKIGNNTSEATSVFVSGSDVYVAGNQKTATSGTAWRTTVWKNGAEFQLSDLPSSANSIFVK